MYRSIKCIHLVSLGLFQSCANDCTAYHTNTMPLCPYQVCANDCTAYETGTSMACPHVSGVIAALLSDSRNAQKTPLEVAQLLSEMATKGKITNQRANTANKLLFFAGDPPTPLDRNCSAPRALGHPCMPLQSSKKAVAWCTAARECTEPVGATDRCGGILEVKGNANIASYAWGLLGFVLDRFVPFGFWFALFVCCLFIGRPYIDRVFLCCFNSPSPLKSHYTRNNRRLCGGRASYDHTTNPYSIRYQSELGNWVINDQQETCDATSTIATYVGGSDAAGYDVVDASRMDGTFEHANHAFDTRPMVLSVAKVPCRDADNDGYGARQTGGIDCNDDDAATLDAATCVVGADSCLVPSKEGTPCQVEGKIGFCGSNLSCETASTACGRYVTLATDNAEEGGAFAGRYKRLAHTCGNTAVFMRENRTSGLPKYMSYDAMRLVWFISNTKCKLAQPTWLAVGQGVLAPGVAANFANLRSDLGSSVPLTHLAISEATDAVQLDGTTFYLHNNETGITSSLAVSVPSCSDVDGDGFGAVADGGYDCDDTDSAVTFDFTATEDLKCVCSSKWTIILMDGYGDGWNGASVTVAVNGVPAPGLRGFGDGIWSQISLEFTVAQGDTVIVRYRPGRFDEEASFNVLDGDEHLRINATYPFDETYTTSVQRYAQYCNDSSTLLKPPDAPQTTLRPPGTPIPHANDCTLVWHLKLTDTFVDGWNGNAAEVVLSHNNGTQTRLEFGADFKADPKDSASWDATLLVQWNTFTVHTYDVVAVNYLPVGNNFHFEHGLSVMKEDFSEIFSGNGDAGWGSLDGWEHEVLAGNCGQQFTTTTSTTTIEDQGGDLPGLNATNCWRGLIQVSFELDNKAVYFETVSANDFGRTFVPSRTNLVLELAQPQESEPVEGDADTGCGALKAIQNPGGILLIKRGVCTFAEKTYWAQRAGAAYAIIYNTASQEDITGMQCGDNYCNELNDTMPLFVSNAVGVKMIDHSKETGWFVCLSVYVFICLLHC